LLTVYQTFLDGHLQNFSEDVKNHGNNLIKAALGLHTLVSNTFRKTATNFFYEFNMRHISSVFQGLLAASPETTDELVRLWLHESERVYGDRLVSTEDVSKYNTLAQAQCKKVFSSFPVAKFYSKENAEPLLFSHNTGGTGEDCAYKAVTSIPELSSVLTDALKEYNETHATMDLVLFEDAVRHITRITRIIRNEGGHALLIGVGGSGKQSLARLAAFLCDFTVVT